MGSALLVGKGTPSCLLLGACQVAQSLSGLAPASRHAQFEWVL